MGFIVKSRHIPELIWQDEAQEERDARRRALCELDGLLTDLEECNLRGTAVPSRVRAALGRNGLRGWRLAGAPELIDEIFDLQERFMLQPELAAHSGAAMRDLEELRRRIAS